MRQIKKSLFILIPFTIVLILTGCSQSTEEKIYDILEQVAKLESPFEEQQQPLVELEERENAIYNEIVELGLKEKDRVHQLSDEALDVLDQQKERILKEKESLEAGREKFSETKKYIEEIDEEELKNDAEDLYGTMNERYDVYDQLHEQYVQKIEYSKELYLLFKQDEPASLDVLEPQINKINETLKMMHELNEEFNRLTEKYNDGKVAFYKKAGLNVQIKEE